MLILKLKNIVSKDSLDMDDNDRQIITDAVKSSENEKIIIIHGTDTVHLTSAFLKEQIDNKTNSIHWCNGTYEY